MDGVRSEDSTERTRQRLSWANSRLVAQDPVEAVDELLEYVPTVLDRPPPAS